MTAKLQTAATPMSAIDSLIAATALHRRMILVTRNVNDFLHADLELLNPWT
ncbi:hypothetical protein JW905_19365 [bacterium]|nr:hypothetical protein [candidate division CSSED10-310 bacterium]